MRGVRRPVVPFLLSCILCPPVGAEGTKAGIHVYRLRAPGGVHSIDQASDLHFGKLGNRNGLWTVCDRNGGESAGKIYFFSRSTLEGAKAGGTLVADDEFTVVAPKEDWSAFAIANARAGEEVLTDVRKRITPEAARGDEPYLDLEAITIGRSLKASEELRLFVVAEEPYSVILELMLEGAGKDGRVRLAALYRYDEPSEQQGTARNDGLEGLAWSGKPGRFYFVEEGTRSHTEEARPLMMFRDPTLGLGDLKDGRLYPDPKVSDGLSVAVRKRRKGPAQTLNGLAVLRDGRMLAVDRNGGFILRIEPDKGIVEPWLNLYDLSGKDLRVLLADFPQRRKMPYISIEGVAVDDQGAIWLVDDPAIPEGWRESCLVRIVGAIKP